MSWVCQLTTIGFEKLDNTPYLETILDVLEEHNAVEQVLVRNAEALFGVARS